MALSLHGWVGRKSEETFMTPSLPYRSRMAKACAMQCLTKLNRTAPTENMTCFCRFHVLKRCRRHLLIFLLSMFKDTRMNICMRCAQARGERHMCKHMGNMLDFVLMSTSIAGPVFLFNNIRDVGRELPWSPHDGLSMAQRRQASLCSAKGPVENSTS